MNVDFFVIRPSCFYKYVGNESIAQVMSIGETTLGLLKQLHVKKGNNYFYI